MTANMNEHAYRNAAIRAADWLAATQCRDIESADCGRFVYALHLPTRDYTLSSGWQTAFGVFALLSTHRLTGDYAYLDAAQAGVLYIKTLQIVDPRVPQYSGAFREITPQTGWMHPRDGVSAAWALLGYHLYAGDDDALERATRYADWLLERAFLDDWIVATVNLGAPASRPSDDMMASCQSGTILFLIDLYRVTQDKRYRDAAKRLADSYVAHFIDASGEITTVRDRNGGNTAAHDTDTWPLDWQRMHQVNDDFGGVALVDAYRILDHDVYLQRCSAYFAWLEARINPDGSYLDPIVEVGSATVSIFLASYASLAPQDRAERIASLNRRCLAFLLSVQRVSEDPWIDGAFLGMDPACTAGHGDWINIRCTAYAIIALCRQLGAAIFPLSNAELYPKPSRTE
jgi:hypothetical protein